MSGRAEVAELLKQLSSNTIGIAEAANRARESEDLRLGKLFGLGEHAAWQAEYSAFKDATPEFDVLNQPGDFTSL